MENFSIKISEVARRLDGARLPALNMNSLIVNPYTNCKVEEFDIFAINMHARADTTTAANAISIFDPNPTSTELGWENLVSELITCFCQLKAQDK